MVLGALIDAGVPLDDVRRALGSLAIAPDLVWTDRVVRAGVTATKFRVRGEDERMAALHDHAHDHRGGHDHDHPHDHLHAQPNETVHHSGEQPHEHAHRTL